MRALGGFDKDFSKTYETLFALVYRIAFRITGDESKAEDACHESFIKYYERGSPLPDADQTKYWLIRVVRNIALNGEKRKTRERLAYERWRRMIAPRSVSSSEETYIRAETERTVQKALTLLPNKLRIVLVLKEYEGLTYKKIASIIGISEGNVKVRVFRAREKLQLIFKEMEKNVS